MNGFTKTGKGSLVSIDGWSAIHVSFKFELIFRAILLRPLSKAAGVFFLSTREVCSSEIFDPLRMLL